MRDSPGHQYINYITFVLFRNCYKKFTQLLHKKGLTKQICVYNIYLYIRYIKYIRYINYSIVYIYNI
jgi:hypothetical protein